MSPARWNSSTCFALHRTFPQELKGLILILNHVRGKHKYFNSKKILIYNSKKYIIYSIYIILST